MRLFHALIHVPPPAALPSPHLLQVVYGHLDDPEGQEIKRGVSYLNLRPGGWVAASGGRWLMWGWEMPDA